MTADELFENSPRKIAMTAGILYLLTFVSVPTLWLYKSIHNPNYVIGAGPDTDVFIGGVLEIIVALAGIGTAVGLYPVFKKQNEVLALSFVGIRVLEAATIFVGVAFLLAVVTLRQSGIGDDALIAGQTLVALYDRIFLIGQSFIPAVDDAIIGYLFYKSRVIPRTLAIIGLIGVPVLIAGDILVLFGFIGQRDPSTGMFAIPVALFEFSLGILLVVKGFNFSQSSSHK